jgi:hypothetical protein
MRMGIRLLGWRGIFAFPLVMLVGNLSMVAVVRLFRRSLVIVDIFLDGLVPQDPRIEEKRQPFMGREPTHERVRDEFPRVL